MNKGNRVAIHPAESCWMQGDRYGEIVGRGHKREYRDTFTGETVVLRPWRVKLDSSRVVRLPESSIIEVIL